MCDTCKSFNENHPDPIIIQNCISVWKKTDNKIRSIVDDLCNTSAQRIYDIVFDEDNNTIEVTYASFGDLENGESKYVIFNASYLTMEKDQYIADWKRIEEEKAAAEYIRKTKEERDRRYQEFLKLKAEFEP